MSSIGALDVLLTQDPFILRKEKKNIMSKLINKFLSEDIDKVLNSRYNVFYRHVSNLGINEMYLDLGCNVIKLRLISQIRLCRMKCAKLYLNGSTYTFDCDDICLICSSSCEDSIMHFLFECKTLQQIRSYFLSNFLATNFRAPKVILFEKLLTIKSKDQVNAIHNYCKQSLRIRSFVLGE